MLEQVQLLTLFDRKKKSLRTL